MIVNLLRALLGAAIDGIQRFPVTAVALVVTAIIANLDIADGLDLHWTKQQQVYQTLAAFIIMSLVKQIALESRGYNRSLQHLAALAAGAIAAALVWFAKDIGLLELAFFSGLIGAVLVSAHWFRGTSAGFWFFVLRLLFASGLALVAVVVFSLGLSAIFASLDYLFGVDVPSDIYGHIWATGLIAAGPLFALGRIPEDFDALPVINGDNHGIAGLRLLSDYLAVPLLVIYALILHAYAAKIIFTGEVPQNQIGWMVIGYGTLIIFFWKVMLPLRDVLTTSGRMFLRFWPLITPIPMLLLFYALWLRISNYGVTPDRYFLVAFAMLMTLFAGMQAIPFLRNWLPGAAPLTVIALLLGSFGPWGAERYSVNSQIRQLVSILDEKTQVVFGEGKRASNILAFLRKQDALQELESITENLENKPFEATEKDTKYKLFARLEKAFGVDQARKEDDSRKGRRTLNFSKNLVSISGFDLHHRNFYLTPRTSSDNARQLRPDLKVWASKNAFMVIHKGVETSFPLDPMFKASRKLDKNPKAQGFLLKSEGKEILLVPQYLSLKAGANAGLKGGNTDIFLRSADWQ